jgi:tyrosine-protein kinase Etk/Wzc
MADDANYTSAQRPRGSGNTRLIASGRDDDEIDLREVFDRLKTGRWLIACCVAATTLLGVFYILFARPTYSVSGLVQVSQQQMSGTALAAQTLGGLANLLAGGGPLVTEAEMQIIQSRLVLNPAIDKLNLLVHATPHYFPVFGYAIANWNGPGGTKADPRPSGAPWLLGRYAWGGESISVAEFETSAADYDQAFTLKATTGGYTLVGPEGDTVLKGTVGVPASGNTVNGTVHILVRKLVARPGETFKVTRFARQTVLKDIDERLSVVEQGKQSGVVQIGVTNHDPLAARALIDAIEQSYIEQDIHKNSKQAMQSLTYLEAQLPDLRKKLDAAQEKLADYQRTHGAPNVAAETDLLLKQAVALDTEKSQLVQQREQALRLFTPRHREVIAIERQIATVEDNQAQLERKIANLPSTQQKVLDLQRDLAVNTQLYTTMLDAIEQFQVTKAGTVGAVRIVDGGMLPLKPVSPRKALTLVLAILLGCILGVAWTFLRRVLLRGVDDPLLIEEITGVEVVASIPVSKAQKQVDYRARALSRPGSLLAAEESGDSAIEALRSLRTALRLDTANAANKILMFTGPAPAVGKSFVSANYAALLAIAGVRVALVDLDLRRGHLGDVFGLDHAQGMCEVLKGDATLKAVCQSTSIPNLDFYAHGARATNPSELLMLPSLQESLAALETAYDQVIVDVPPVLAVTDAAIVGVHAGATLLVLESARHPVREIDAAMKRLRTARVNVTGVVLNRVGARAGSYGYGGYGYQYEYGYATDADGIAGRRGRRHEN